MIIDGAVYRSGKRATPECSLPQLARDYPTLQAPGDFMWFGLHDATDEEMADIGQMLGLHRLAIEDVVEPHQRPKIDRYGNHVFVVVKTLTYEDEGDAVETGEINAFLGEHFFVTVRDGKHALSHVREGLESHERLLTHGASAALYAVLDSVVDQYEDVASDLEADVEEVESSIFSDERTHDSARIYRLKREVLEVRRAVMPLREPMGRIVRGDFDFVSEHAIPFFRDVADHLARVSDNIDSLDNLLDNALNAHLAQLGVRQNEDMRKLAAYAAMFAAPTLIAGVYGMNFDHMPELAWRYGYPVCLVVMVAVVAVLWRSFKKSGWL